MTAIKVFLYLYTDYLVFFYLLCKVRFLLRKNYVETTLARFFCELDTLRPETVC